MSSLSITDLFTPAPSGVDPNNPTAPPPASTWRAGLYYIASKIGLSTTSWLTGGITRTILALVSVALNAADQIVSIDLQGGFLDWAASVTQDPATVQASQWIPGWLDQLAISVYDQTRSPATYAPVTMTINNVSSTTYPTFAPGSYHVQNPTTGLTYSNVNSLTIAPGLVTGIAFLADQIGASSAAINTITSPVTALVGVTVTNPTSAIGSNAQSNASLVSQCRASLSALSPNGPKAAYAYFAKQASAILALQTPSVPLLNGPITGALVQTNTDTGTITTTIANAAGATDGVANLSISAASNTIPIVLTVSSISAAGGSLANNDWCYVSGVFGNTAANGWFHAASVSDTSVTLAGSSGNGAYINGGSLEGGDLGLVDYIIQSNAVGNADTAITQWATTQGVAFGVTIWVPLAQVPSVQAIAQSAIVTYIGAVPIGGYLPPVTLTNAIPLNGLNAAIAEALGNAGISVLNIVGSFFVGGAPTFLDLPMGVTSKAILSGTPVVNVVGV